MACGTCHEEGHDERTCPHTPNIDLAADLAALLERLRVADPKLRVFGSDNHKYRVGPVLSEADLSAFEAAHGIVLPDDYRCFLKMVGNGGAGPYYGMFPLDDGGTDLSAPFPYATETPPSEEELAWLSALSEYPGGVQLCDQGCGTSSYLLTSGPARGTIWEGDMEFLPTGLSFGVWYRNWLERALRTLENEKLVSRLRVGMTRAEVLAAVRGNWYERPAVYKPGSFLEAAEIPAELELDQRGLVVAVKPWPFIPARPW